MLSTVFRCICVNVNTHARTHAQKYFCYSDFSGLKTHLKGDYDYDYDSYGKSIDYGKVRIQAIAQIQRTVCVCLLVATRAYQSAARETVMV